MNTVNGLPVHVLLVHAIVVLMPLSALLLVLTAFRPSARRRFAGPNALLAWFTVVLVPITTSAGEWLEQHLARNDLIRRHADIGGTAIYCAIALGVLTTIVWWRERESVATRPAALTDDRSTPAGGTLTKPATARRSWLAPTSTRVTRIIAALAVLVALTTLYDMYKIGDSGAKASWNGKVTSAPYRAG